MPSATFHTQILVESCSLGLPPIVLLGLVGSPGHCSVVLLRELRLALFDICPVAALALVGCETVMSASLTGSLLIAALLPGAAALAAPVVGVALVVGAALAGGAALFAGAPLVFGADC